MSVIVVTDFIHIGMCIPMYAQAKRNERLIFYIPCTTKKIFVLRIFFLGKRSVSKKKKKSPIFIIPHLKNADFVLTDGTLFENCYEIPNTFS